MELAQTRVSKPDESDKLHSELSKSNDEKPNYKDTSLKRKSEETSPVECDESDWESLTDFDQKRRQFIPSNCYTQEIRYKQLKVLHIFIDKSATRQTKPELLTRLKILSNELYAYSPLKASGEMLPLDWNLFARFMVKLMGMLSLKTKYVNNLILPLSDEKEALVERARTRMVPYYSEEDELYRALRASQTRKECIEWYKMGRRHLSSYRGKFGLVINKVRKNRSPRSYACRKKRFV